MVEGRGTYGSSCLWRIGPHPQATSCRRQRYIWEQLAAQGRGTSGSSWQHGTGCPCPPPLWAVCREAGCGAGAFSRGTWLEAWRGGTGGAGEQERGAPSTARGAWGREAALCADTKSCNYIVTAQKQESWERLRLGNQCWDYHQCRSPLILVLSALQPVSSCPLLPIAACCPCSEPAELGGRSYSTECGDRSRVHSAGPWLQHGRGKPDPHPPPAGARLFLGVMEACVGLAFSG